MIAAAVTSYDICSTEPAIEPLPNQPSGPTAPHSH
jgi:hypothetical protein